MLGQYVRYWTIEGIVAEALLGVREQRNRARTSVWRTLVIRATKGLMVTGASLLCASYLRGTLDGMRVIRYRLIYDLDRIDGFACPPRTQELIRPGTGRCRCWTWGPRHSIPRQRDPQVETGRLFELPRRPAIRGSGRGRDRSPISCRKRGICRRRSPKVGASRTYQRPPHWRYLGMAQCVASFSNI